MRLLAELGRAPGDAEARVDLLFAPPGGERLERLDVGLRAGGADELGAEAPARGDDELDGDALHGDADGATLAALDHGHDLGKSLETIQRIVVG